LLYLPAFLQESLANNAKNIVSGSARCTHVGLTPFEIQFRIRADCDCKYPSWTKHKPRKSGASAGYEASGSKRGWVLQQNHLYWTEDNGQDWADITPVEPQLQVGSVFFLNESDGWVLLYGTGTAGDNPAIQIAFTHNSGQSWQMSTIGADALLKKQFLGSSSLFFVDIQHGWLVLRVASSSNFSFGVLLKQMMVVFRGQQCHLHQQLVPSAL